MFSQLSALLEVVYRGPAPPSQVAALMEEFDSNRDGRVSLDEFVAGVATIKREQHLLSHVMQCISDARCVLQVVWSPGQSRVLQQPRLPSLN